MSWEDLPPTLAVEEEGSQPGTLRLTMIGPDGVSARILRDSERLTIGRAPTHAITLDDPEVSRDHAALTVGAVTWIEDLGSANGTFVNDERLPPKTPKSLAPGHSFRIGKTMFALQTEAMLEGLSPEDQQQRNRILDALNRTAGNQKEAASLLGISRRTLSNWLDRYQIPRPRKRSSGVDTDSTG